MWNLSDEDRCRLADLGLSDRSGGLNAAEEVELLDLVKRAGDKEILGLQAIRSAERGIPLTVAASTLRSGVPHQIEDPVAVRKLAALLALDCPDTTRRT